MPELDNFHHIDDIGEGSQGVVRLYSDIRLGRRVAIKSLHPHLITNQILRDRFVEEAKLLAQLNHHSIVTLFDYIQEDSFHLVMEYIEGSALDSYISEQNGPIHELRAINIFIKILEGIGYIHSKNIIHRDLKPSNIILRSDDSVKLLDFGIAKNHDEDPRLTQVGAGVGGTPMYMSPEHVHGKDIDSSSDIYCLGVTLWQMITGKVPYDNMNQYEIYNNIVNEPLPKVTEIYKHVSTRMQNVIEKAVSKNKTDRYDSCDSFIRALDDVKSFLLNDGRNPSLKSKKIDVKILNAQKASIIINDKGFKGSELTHYVEVGTAVKVSVDKQDYYPVVSDFICNADRVIRIRLLRKRNKLFIAIAIFFSLFLIFTIINFFS
jgi:serine/threonine protein kinase